MPFSVSSDSDDSDSDISIPEDVSFKHRMIPAVQDAFRAKLKAEALSIGIITNVAAIPAQENRAAGLLQQGEILEVLLEIGSNVRVKNCDGNVAIIPQTAITTLGSVSVKQEKPKEAKKKERPKRMKEIIQNAFRKNLEEDGKVVAVASKASKGADEDDDFSVEAGEVLEVKEDYGDKALVGNCEGDDGVIKKRYLIITSEKKQSVAEPVSNSIKRLDTDVQLKFLELLDKTDARRLRVRQDYKAALPNQISVFAGEIVELIAENADKVSVKVRSANGLTGFVPQVYLSEILRRSPSKADNSVVLNRKSSNPVESNSIKSSKLQANYVENQLIGQGSYGRAILATRRHDNRQVVIKEVRFNSTGQTDEKVRAEALLLKENAHKWIVLYLTHFEENSCLYIVTEYCPGGNLMNSIKEKRAQSQFFEETLLQNWLLHIAYALEHLHGRRIIHRDLKPENIFLTADNDVKIGDFGVAADLQQTVASGAKTYAGTLTYMAPEIMLSEGKRYNEKVDIWSLGILTYHLAVLKLPYGNGQYALLAKMQNQEPREPMPDRCSSYIKRFVDKLLIFDPEARPSIDKVLGERFLKKNLEPSASATVVVPARK